MPAATGPVFPPATIAFLRALARNNDREWFRARKDRYERDVRGPMIAVLEALDRDFRTFAPEFEASPRVCLFRPYRDTRFSEDKSPLKTNVAAVLPQRGLARTQGAALYFEVSPGGVLIAAGLHAPSPPELRTVRNHIAANLSRFRSIVESPAFVRDSGGLKGDTLTRMPRGFPPGHPAERFLKMKQFLVWREYPAAFATTPRFYGTLLQIFRAAAPLVRFLNEPILVLGPTRPGR
jgi:uncharacterized protein (TIGR02453 family)